MASEPDKRSTQLDFKRLRGLWEPKVSHVSPEDSSSAHEAVKTKEVSPKKLDNQAPETVQSKRGQKLKLVKQVTQTHPSLDVKQGSPWEKYNKMYALRLGLDHRAIVAEERNNPGENDLADVYSIRCFTDVDRKTIQDVFQYIRHQNFVHVHEMFWLEKVCHVVLEHMPCSLYELRGNEYLTEPRLAAIVGQKTLDGLLYLEESGLEHGSLTSSNIFLGYDGIVKIGEQEQCHKTSSPGPRKHVQALGLVVMDLIAGDHQDDTDDTFDRWSDTHALDFSVKAVSADAAADVSQHPLLQLGWRRVSLIGLVNFSVAKVRRGCRGIVDVFDFSSK